MRTLSGKIADVSLQGGDDLPDLSNLGGSMSEAGDPASASQFAAANTNSVSVAGSGLVFNNTFGSGVTAAYEAAVVAAENFFQAHFTNAGTFSCDFDLQNLGANFSAHNSYYPVTVPYAEFVSALSSHTVTADDRAAVASLPTIDPSSGKGFAIAIGEARILGLAPATTSGFDDTIELNSSLAWSYTQDAIGALEHEISEGIMGRFGGLGVENGEWGPMDLFRYSSAGHRDYTGGADGLPTYFSVDGANLTLPLHNSISPTNVFDGYDLADWNGTTGDAFGPGGPGSPGTVSATDLQVLDVLGWTPANVAPTVVAVTASPSTADLGIGQVATLTVTLSDAVTVAGGVPALLLNDGGTAIYTGGSGTSSLTFSYKVVAGQNTPDLTVTGSTLNGAKILDPAGNSADLTGVVTNPAGTLQIDTTPPPPGKVVLHGSVLQYIVADDSGSLCIEDTIGGRDGTQIISGVNQMVFTDGIGLFDDSGNAEDVARLYKVALGRAPDALGVEAWATAVDSGTMSLTAVANDFTVSPEFIQDYGSLSNPAFINQLYQNALGRPADAAGAQYWNNALAAGLSRGAIVLNFAESEENKSNTVATAGDVDDAEVYRLYEVTLGRTPDSGGRGFWSSFLANGGTPVQMAQNLIGSAEFQQHYGGLSPSDFVTTLYENTLHRAPDAQGLQSWVNYLQGGGSEASVVIGFADSLENRIQTASATHDNWVFTKV